MSEKVIPERQSRARLRLQPRGRLGQVSGRRGPDRAPFTLYGQEMNPRIFTTAVLAHLAALTVSAFAVAEPPPPPPGLRWKEPSFAVNAGLLQPILLGGANIEVDFRWGYFVAGYSHGWSLELPGSSSQHVKLHLPYSTGFGIGVTFPVAILNSFFDLRLEGKVHRFEASYDSADGSHSTAIASYSTYTLGAGAYWTFVPFARRTDALRGIDISTSFRVWPNVASTLPGGQITYANTTTGRDEVHETANIGIANTPIVANVSIGYVFQ